jgi:hypothetical protein
MKLNFWQWLGVALLILGVYLFARRDDKKKQPVQPNNNPVPAVTAPAATVPATTGPAPAGSPAK